MRGLKCLASAEDAAEVFANPVGERASRHCTKALGRSIEYLPTILQQANAFSKHAHGLLKRESFFVDGSVEDANEDGHAWASKQ
jgi:hypothetical protein